MEKELEKINSKLNVLIGILIQPKNSGEKIAEKDVIKWLSDLGMDYGDIGKIFGKTPHQVSKQIYETKRKKIKPESKNE